jgi:hypothetical protein
MLKKGMNGPFVNIEEHIPRVVGRRTKAPNGLSVTGSNRAAAEEWRRVFGGVRVPKGVYRFRTHEEADEWMWRNISRPRG